jgi:hypothetical protein
MAPLFNLDTEVPEGSTKEDGRVSDLVDAKIASVKKELKGHWDL